MVKLASLVIRHKSKYVDKEYSYIAGEDIEAGHRVLVQFGKPAAAPAADSRIYPQNTDQGVPQCPAAR